MDLFENEEIPVVIYLPDEDRLIRFRNLDAFANFCERVMHLGDSPETDTGEA